MFNKFLYTILLVLAFTSFEVKAANIPPPGSNGNIIYNNNNQYGALNILWNTVTTIPQSGYRPEGDDVTASSDSGGATIRFVNPLASDLGVQVTNNRGTQGAMACDIANLQMIQNENPGASSNPLYTVEAGINDAFYKGAGSYVTGVYRRCMQSTLSWLSIPSTSKTYFNNCTLVGSWGHASYSSFSFPFTDVAGDTISCNFTTSGGPVYLWYDMQDARGSAAFNYNIDSGTITGSVNAFTSPSISTHNGGQEGVGLTRITGVSAGSHNLLLTTTSSGGSGFVVPYAIGTVPASFTTSTPLVFVSGVPQQQNNANSTNTAAYDTEVATDVTTLGPSGDGLPIYKYDIRNATNSPLSQINNTTDMSTALFFANSGQSKIAQGFYNLISSTITGGAVSTVISPSSGGLGINAGTATGAVSFSGGTAQIGTLGIGFGGTNATTAQGALNNLFMTGSVTASSIVPTCNGTNDAAALVAAIPTANAAHTSILTPKCGLTSQVQGTFGNTYAFFYGPSNAWSDLDNGDAITPNSIGINTSNISTTPYSTAFDMHGIVNIAFKDINIKGTGNSTPAGIVSQSLHSPAGPGNDTITFNNLVIGDVRTAMGATTDDSGSSLNAGGISSAGSTIALGTSGYTPGFYQNVPLTGGSGTGAVASLVAIGTTGAMNPVSATGIVPGISSIVGGTNYHVGDVLGIGTSIIGNGSGFSLTVNSVFGTGALANYFPNGNGVGGGGSYNASPGTITGGTGYVNGVYPNVPLTGGTGTGATATITVSGGAVASVILSTSSQATTGSGYYKTDVLSASSSNLGGTGSGFSITNLVLQPASAQVYTLPHAINTIVGNYGCGFCGEFTDLYAWGNDFGGGGPGIFGGGADILGGGTTGSGGGSQIWMNRFEFSSGLWSFGGFSEINNNMFTGDQNAPFDLLLAGKGNGAVVGNRFESAAAGSFGTASQFTSAVQIGMPRLNASIGTNAGLAFVGNSMASGSNGIATAWKNGCIDFEGTGDDYLDFEGNTCLTNIPAVFFGTEHPAHAAYGIVGPQGFWAWTGLPMGVGTDTPLAVGTATLDVEGTSSIHIPVGSTGQRPTGQNGLVRANNTLNQYEGYINGAWNAFFTSLNVGAGVSTSPTSSAIGSVNSGATLYADASYYPTFIGGLVASNDQATPNTIIDTSAGAATSDDNTTLMKISAFTKTTGSWTVGAGNGCLDTGTVANSTWYHMFLVERTDTGIVDELCSTNASFPTMPTNYSKKRYAYSFLTDSSAHIVAFKATPNGDTFYWTTPVLGFNDTGVTTTATLETLSGIPTGVKVHPICRVSMSKDGNSVVLTSPTEEPDIAPSNANPMTAEPGQDITDTTIAAGVTNMVCPYFITNTSAQIRARSSATSTTVSTVVRGWEDTARHTPITQALVMTSGTTLVLPANWNIASNQVWAVGEGGNGATSTSGGTGGGGGGGAIAGISNFADAAGTSETIAIGAGGSGTDTTFSSAAVLKAQHGSNGAVSTGGAAGSTGSSVGTIKHAGGAGGAGSATSHFGGGGGGGAGGFFGGGANGAANSSANGGGGGSNGGGSAGSATTGGNNVYGLGGGTIGNNGLVGGGAGGGNCCQSSVSHLGGTGGSGFEWAGFYGVGFGSGGGGGGGGGDNFGSGGGGNGGTGGLYGAGGGGAGGDGGTTGTGGAAASGEIILIWTQP